MVCETTCWACRNIFSISFFVSVHNLWTFATIPLADLFALGPTHAYRVSPSRSFCGYFLLDRFAFPVSLDKMSSNAFVEYFLLNVLDECDFLLGREQINTFPSSTTLKALSLQPNTSKVPGANCHIARNRDQENRNMQGWGCLCGIHQTHHKLWLQRSKNRHLCVRANRHDNPLRCC